MQFNDDMVLETTIAARDPNGKTIQSRLGDFPQAAVEKALRYGWQRLFNDAVGGSDTDVATKIADAEAMIARFREGKIGREVSAGVDAVTKLARQMVKQALRASNPDGLKRLNKLEAKEQATKLDEILAKNPTIVEKAKKEIARRAKESLTIDTDGMEI